MHSKATQELNAEATPRNGPRDRLSFLRQAQKLLLCRPREQILTLPRELVGAFRFPVGSLIVLIGIPQAD